MNDIWSAYLNMFNKNNNIEKNKHINTTIINEDTDDEDQDIQDTEDTEDENDDEEFQSDEDNDKDSDEQTDNSQSESQQSISNKQQSNKKTAYLNFSADLASEFGNTCNKFTTLAAKVVKQRTVNKQTADQLSKIIEKLKSLIEAANNSI